MPALRIEGYVIVSADGMLANADRVMPDALKFEGDKQFFTAALDRAELIVHGRNSYEDQPNSPRRRRIVLTRIIGSIAPDLENPKAVLWNPAGATFEAALDFAGVKRAATGRRAVLPWRPSALPARNSSRAWPARRRSQNPGRGRRCQRHALATRDRVTPLEHDPEKWAPVFRKIMLKQKDNAGV